MGTRRKYASSKPVMKNPVSFEMIEERLKLIQTGKKITIWIKLPKGNDGKEKQKIVKENVIAVYRNMIHVQVEVRGGIFYNEYFDKFELYNTRFAVK